MFVSVTRGWSFNQKIVYLVIPLYILLHFRLLFSYFMLQVVESHQEFFYVGNKKLQLLHHPKWYIILYAEKDKPIINFQRPLKNVRHFYCTRK